MSVTPLKPQTLTPHVWIILMVVVALILVLAVVSLGLQ
jgi:hypothetical protein